MKKLITIFGITVLIFAGCSNPVETSIEPVNSNFSALNKEIVPGIDSLVSLPSELCIEKSVNGSTGDKVILIGQYINSYGDTVSVDVRLTIPAGAFVGIKNISIRTDSIYPGFKFGPSGVFDKKLKLNATLRGLDVTRYGLASGRTDFVYLADDGSKTLMKHDGVRVDSALKLVEVKGAQIPHFSRYSFIRKSDSKNTSEK